jgi:hypothetical protein
MATKKTGDMPARSNKIRFVLVEADISDGNLSELTNAITNALKPSYPFVQRPTLPRTTTPQILPPAPNGDEPEIEDTEEPETVETESAEEGTTSTPKAPRKKTYKQPQYLPDLFADKGAVFKEFAKERAPKNKQQKYLVAAFWLKEHGNNPTVNADKIFTCFKTAGWSVGVLDWAQPFHNLVHSKEMRKEGNEWVINPLGEDTVNKPAE